MITQTLEEQILSNLNHPAILETLYQSHSEAFSQAIMKLKEQHPDNLVLQVWYHRLTYRAEVTTQNDVSGWWKLMVVILLATVPSFLPSLLKLNEVDFFIRNAGLVVLPFVSAYFAFKGIENKFVVMGMALVYLTSALLINLLPFQPESPIELLSCLHLPIMLWVVTGFAFTGFRFPRQDDWVAFMRFTGEWLVMIAIVVLAGALFVSLTISLFALAGVFLETIFVKHFLIWGWATALITAAWLIDAFPGLVSRVSPVIAQVFGILMAPMLLFFTIVLFSRMNELFNNREFLLVCDILLVAVMAILVFSVSEPGSDAMGKGRKRLLFVIMLMAMLINAIAMSAILYRIGEWGFTANRSAVLGANILLMSNLVLMTPKLWKAFEGEASVAEVAGITARFLPAYGSWALIVAFVFPFIFGF
jgi:hypothetical protein